MRSLRLIAVSVLLFTEPIFTAKAAQPVCAITTNGNIPLKPDREYATLEKGSVNGIDFYMRAARGVVRWNPGNLGN